MLKHYLFILLFFCLNSVSILRGQVPFKIGAETLIPFEFFQDGKAQGINIQLVDTIFKRLNIPYEIVFGTEEVRAFDNLKKGDLDAILSISYKEDRLSTLWYPEGFENEESPQNFMWSSEYVFFVKKGKSTTWKNMSLKELKAENLVVGVIDGVSYSEEFWNSGIRVLKGTNDQENFERLQKGEIDLYLTDKTIGRFTLRSIQLENEITYLPHKLISKPYTLAISLKSTHPSKTKVMKDFYNELEWAKKSGIARKIFMNYLQQTP
jgi:polar amino acid transport system substrate-binding protein